MVRTNIYLDDTQVEALDAQARREGVSRAQVVRRFVDQGLARSDQDVERDLAAIDASFGALAVDGGEFGRTDGARGEHLAELWRS